MTVGQKIMKVIPVNSSWDVLEGGLSTGEALSLLGTFYKTAGREELV